MPYRQVRYIHIEFIWLQQNTTEQLWVKGLAQEPKSGSLVLLGFELKTFRSVAQYINH